MSFGSPLRYAPAIGFQISDSCCHHFSPFRDAIEARPCREEFCTKGRGCPIAVAYVAYPVRKSDAEGKKFNRRCGREDWPQKGHSAAEPQPKRMEDGKV